MQLLVRRYHPELCKTGSTMSELVNGTAFFPGGCGLWRGDIAFGTMPELFPDAPVMFVAHNFDSISAYEKCVEAVAWPFFVDFLPGYLSKAGIQPEVCFFTNALMGLKPGSAVGAMPSVPGYADECQTFLRRQIDIVQPSLLVALGEKAYSRLAVLRPTVPSIRLLHPSAREFKPAATRDELIAKTSRGIVPSIRLPRRELVAAARLVRSDRRCS